MSNVHVCIAIVHTYRCFEEIGEFIGRCTDLGVLLALIGVYNTVINISSYYYNIGFGSANRDHYRVTSKLSVNCGRNRIRRNGDKTQMQSTQHNTLGFMGVVTT